MIIFFDIETAGEVREFSELSPEKQNAWEKKGIEWSDNCAIYPEFARIVCISVGYIMNTELKTKSFVGDESEILKSFSDLCKNNLCGWRIKQFDIPFIVRRMLVNGFKVPNNLNAIGKKPWEITHIDLFDSWGCGSFTLKCTLEECCLSLGIETPKDDISGKDVHSCFYNGEINRIAEYCEKDVISCMKIYKKIYTD